MTRHARWNLLALALLAIACGPRYARVQLFDTPDYKVALRSEKKTGGVVDRQFSQPAAISAVRVAHILSAIDVRVDDDKQPRRSAIPTDMLYDLGDLIAKAFARADSTQEIVVQALRHERTIGIFNHDYLTSFVTWIQGDELYIHFSRTDWRVPKKGNFDGDIPEPVVGEEVMPFKVIGTEGVVPVGAQAVAVAWREERWRRANYVSIGPHGEVRRRNILFETEEPADQAPEPLPEVSGNLSPEALRRLADLEEARRSGAITEAEYARERRTILQEEAGAKAP